MDCIVSRVFTSALDDAEWSASRPDHFTLEERTPVARWIGG
jgi:hypothetical protein